ncbi:MAG: multicopper oxidase domain-containing protein [Bacteriovoracales bacterium]|nr:multicopper oxidase domain-containing protein [Bacteriovoracales bacterium]
MNPCQKLSFWVLLIGLTSGAHLFSAERRYDLRIQNMKVNFTGVEVDHALGIAQTFPTSQKASIPAPTLRFELGDIAVINVSNDTDEPATMHWHGVLVPWRQDGPQFFNTKIIEPKSQHTFRFPIRHTGTYWYHSHTEFQEQRGLYGAIVIEDEGSSHQVDHDLVYVMSDWTNELPKAVLYNIKKDGHYYGAKKNFQPNLWEAIEEGALGKYLKSEWTRMGPMDLSDVGYDAFLINGKIESTLKHISHGEKIRLRIINASASTYFYFNIGRLRNFTVISKDGMPVQPVKVNELLIGIAETYDIIFQMPHEMKTFEARATAQDITGFAVMRFGRGELEEVAEKTRPSPYDTGHGGMDHTQMEMGHDESHGGGGGMKDEASGAHSDHHRTPHHGMTNGGGGEMPMTKRLDYQMLRSVEPSSFSHDLIRAQTIDLELSGDMERYTWYINGKPFSEDKYIEIRENEVITFRFINKTMMHHPMHLHGHFFRVLNGQGDYAPLFHTVDISPMETRSIEFHANEPGIWFLHCHNLYHMKMGMAKLVKYEGFELPKDLENDRKKWGKTMIKDDDMFWKGDLEVASNKFEINLDGNGGRYEVEIEIEVDQYDLDHLRGEAIFKKYLNRFFSSGVGTVIEDQKVYVALVGAYNLPGNVEMVGYLRHDGKAAIKLKKHIPLAVIFNRALMLDLEPRLNYDGQFESKVELHYIYNERIEFGINLESHDGDRSTGLGIKVNF